MAVDSIDRRPQSGFTLLEVVIALAILAINLTVLLTVQASSLDKAGRARDLSIAALLARGKMIDLEQKLFDEGFTMGDQEDQGDFHEEGWPEMKWQAKISEVTLDLSALTGMCGAMGDGEEEGAGGGCESMLSAFGGPVEALTEEIGRSLRVVDLTVRWPMGGKYEDKMTVRALVTREDYGLQAQGLGGLLPGGAGGGSSGGGSSGGGSSGGGKSE